MKKIVLHVGAGKCGSSALQAYLSGTPVLRSSRGETIKYGALGVDGFIATGSAVTEKANSSIFQYSSSVLLSNTNDKNFTDNLRESIGKIDAEILILSCEGWLGQAGLASVKLECLSEYHVEVLVYVRPPVEWLNSAWWQWGAWNNLKFEYWFDRSLPSTYWSEPINEWREIEFVDTVLVRNIPKDIACDFCEIFSIPSYVNNENRSNTSLPGSVLRLFQQFSDLRPSAHEPQIDFTISRRLSEINSRPDWIISGAKVRQALAATEPYNRDLLSIMSLEQRETMQSNIAWWDEAHYIKNTYLDPCSRSISDQEKNSLMYHSIVSLHRAESEILVLRNKVRKLSKPDCNTETQE